MSETPAARPARTRAVTHADIAGLVSGLEALTSRMDPVATALTELLPHIPTLITIAKATDAASNGLSTFGRVLAWLDRQGKRMLGLAVPVGLIWAAFHLKGKELAEVLINWARQ